MLIRKFFSRFSLFFMLSSYIFFILIFTLLFTGTVVYLLLRFGHFTPLFTRSISAFIGVLTGISLIIGIGVTRIVGRHILKPIHEMLESMKQLAGGNFDIRIRSTGLFRPKELIDFAEQFNDTARDLGGIEMLRSEFVNNFSHEFKTPIVSLRGFAKLLRDGDLTEEEHREYLDIIISESDRLAALATNVLNLSKIESQAIIAEKTVFDLGEQIRRAILMMSAKWEEKGLVLEVDLEDIQFSGNAELLSQVWVNILDNAVKYSPRGCEVEVRLYDDSDEVVCKVRDCGCGMDAETMAHIFDKFYQGDRSHATEGNGLGLAVVKKIVELHKGQISVESKTGEGTLVTITLPK